MNNLWVAATTLFGLIAFLGLLLAISTPTRAQRRKEPLVNDCCPVNGYDRRHHTPGCPNYRHPWWLRLLLKPAVLRRPKPRAVVDPERTVD